MYPFYVISWSHKTFNESWKYTQPATGGCTRPGGPAATEACGMEELAVAIHPEEGETIAWIEFSEESMS